MRSLRLPVALLAVFAVSTPVTTPTLAQTNAASSLNELALTWAQGSYGSPLMCEFDGRPVRGLRRIHVEPGPTHRRPPVGEIRFVDLEAEEASRCMDDLGEPQPNIIGSLEIRLPGGHSPRATDDRDFKNALQREQGFEYTIVSGRLRIQSVGTEASAKPREVDFAGGQVRLKLAQRGSDAARALRDFPTVRKALLTIEAREGSSMDFPLFLDMSESRQRPAP